MGIFLPLGMAWLKGLAGFVSIILKSEKNEINFYKKFDYQSIMAEENLPARREQVLVRTRDTEFPISLDRVSLPVNPEDLATENPVYIASPVYRNKLGIAGYVVIDPIPEDRIHWPPRGNMGYGSYGYESRSEEFQRALEGEYEIEKGNLPIHKHMALVEGHGFKRIIVYTVPAAVKSGMENSGMPANVLEELVNASISHKLPFELYEEMDGEIDSFGGEPFPYWHNEYSLGEEILGKVNEFNRLVGETTGDNNILRAMQSFHPWRRNKEAVEVAEHGIMIALHRLDTLLGRLIPELKPDSDGEIGSGATISLPYSIN